MDKKYALKQAVNIIHIKSLEGSIEEKRAIEKAAGGKYLNNEGQIESFNASILIINEDEETLKSVFSDLCKRKYLVWATTNRIDGLELLKHRKFDIMFINKKAEEDEGILDLIYEANFINENMATVITAQKVYTDFSIKAIKQGVYYILHTPVSIKDITGLTLKSIRDKDKKKNEKSTMKKKLKILHKTIKKLSAENFNLKERLKDYKE